ncbi:MAG: acyltransferase [Prevotella sp.]|nr:acyltransferase [Prevotella sp.]
MMKGNVSLNLKTYTLFREELMGVATIMIILCHIVGNDVLLPPIVLKVLTLGNYGVDVFMFLSGLGLFYSLRNNFQTNIVWYKKRYIRIFIPYLIMTLFYCVVRFGVHEFSILDIILSLSTLDFWIYGRGAWYISAILPLYFLTPYLSKLIESRKNKFSCTILIILILIILSKVSISDNEILTNIQFVLSRVPMFILGYWLARYTKGEICITIKNAVLLTILSIIFYVFLNIYTVLAIPILIALGYFVNWIDKLYVVDLILRFMGKISLESYLANIYIPEIIRHINFGDLGIGNYLSYGLVVIIGIPFAYFINRISFSLINKIR